MEILQACEQLIGTFTSLTISCYAEPENTYLKLKEVRQVAGLAHCLTHSPPYWYNDSSVQSIPPVGQRIIWVPLPCTFTVSTAPCAVHSYHYTSNVVLIVTIISGSEVEENFPNPAGQDLTTDLLQRSPRSLAWRQSFKGSSAASTCILPRDLYMSIYVAFSLLFVVYMDPSTQKWVDSTHHYSIIYHISAVANVLYPLILYESSTRTHNGSSSRKSGTQSCYIMTRSHTTPATGLCLFARISPIWRTCLPYRWSQYDRSSLPCEVAVL